MELGGENPFIVLEDADVDAAAKRGVACIVSNAGQSCNAPGRFYVQERIYKEFIDKFVEEANKVVVGNPMDPKTQLGPVVSAEHRDRVEEYVKIGIREGAKLVLGGKRPTTPPLDKGFFVMPTVFTDVTQNMRIGREEIFGPVGCIMKFVAEDEVIEKANDSNYGLCASVWTKNIAKGIRFANEICSGTLWINDHTVFSPELPWGGFKESGFGKEISVVGLEEFTQMKLMAIDYQTKDSPQPDARPW